MPEGKEGQGVRSWRDKQQFMILVLNRTTGHVGINFIGISAKG